MNTMNELKLNPKMPSEGEPMLCLNLQRGLFTVEAIGTVMNRARFSLTSDEFTTTNGSRYDCKYVHPTDLWLSALEQFPDSAIFLYCRASDRAEAEKALRAHYVNECNRAQEALQADARKLHEYAGLCVKR